MEKGSETLSWEDYDDFGFYDPQYDAAREMQRDMIAQEERKIVKPNRTGKDSSDALAGDFRSIIIPPGWRDKLGESIVLISGAVGLIGSYLVEFLAWLNDTEQLDIDIVGLDNFVACDSDRLEHLAGRKDVTIIAQDITVCDLWWSSMRLGKRKKRWIVNAASIASPIQYQRHPVETLTVNVIGTRSMLEVARDLKIDGFLHFSSSEVYGSPLLVPTPETYVAPISSMTRRSCYDIGKLAGETMCWLYRDKVPVKIARPHNIYGPGHRLNDGRIVPALMNAAINKVPFVVYGDGTATRSYCYLSDALVQLFAVLFDGQVGEAYNVGNQESEVSAAQFAEIGRELFGIVVHHELDSLQVKDAPQRRRPDTRKVMALGCPYPIVSLEEGLRSTWEWHKGGRHNDLLDMF